LIAVVAKLKDRGVRAFSLAYSNIKANIVGGEVEGISLTASTIGTADLTQLRWVEKF
jgi:hypothetical protein